MKGNEINIPQKTDIFKYAIKASRGSIKTNFPMGLERK
jgi:hypothetical protein